MSGRDDRAFPDPAGVVDVIVPVYRGFEETRRCIESVLKAHCTTPFELVLIDDASPEPELASYCASLGNQMGVTVLANARNLGFVGSVNRGMSLHPDRDVVLLNSDTVVANDWLDRLRRCAYSQADIGTATPFSNNATICSYPVFCADNAMPAGIGLAELDSLFARVNAGEHVEIPTAIGFCVYIRRACLNQV
ncbi:MAG: glycosyltransferase, partial [Thiobacillus sp.]|nr:glycosyltransferase [Thiobacillus sp.]